ncbi:MAG: DNA polymerase III subunit delta [Gammaproteobacteria bacterium]|nr:DNA polymerase III subunit delta [Gammaproteobacteria bacterium]PCH64639.1 MAG: DNA polymerase III subunit delta [Gammaproteobacteria bacterium]
MKIDARELPVHGKKPLLPCYLVSGDELLLVQEAVDQLRQAAVAQGFDSREVHQVEAGFDWPSLVASADALSLFSNRRIIELRFSKPTPGDAGSKALRELAQQLPVDTVFLIIMPKFDAKAKSAAWFKALDKVGGVIQVWPLERRELDQWLSGRLRQQGLNAEEEAIRLLANYVEGNLLAAVQEIDKLKLAQSGERITAELIEASISDNARFDVFGLVDSALVGDIVRVQRMVTVLEKEGVAPTLVLWALSRELRTLVRLAEKSGKAGHVDSNLARSLGVWQKRLPLVSAALKRQDIKAWQRLLRRAARADRVIKGAEVGSAWGELLQLALAIAGAAPLPVRNSA